MDKRLPLLALTFSLLPFSGSGQRADTASPSIGLSDLFKPGIILQDRNGDAAIDFVDVRIVLQQHPSDGELAAAADVAARLGFETSAMNLPLAKPFQAGAVSPSESAAAPQIFVGAKSLAGSGVTVDAIGGAGLKAGDGLVAAFTASGKPAFALLGADDDGLNAAAVMLGGHLPYVWDPKGPTTEKVVADITHFLAGKGITTASALASAILVHRNTDGVERLTVDLQMASFGDVVKAQVALNQFKAISGRDPKRALSYASVRTVLVRLRAPGSGTVPVDLPRAGGAAVAADTASNPPPARRPGGGAKENFDLSTFYAIDGALADSDNNLIPDRVDVLLSAAGEGTSGVVDLAARLGLESTGIAIPIAKPPKAIQAPDTEPMLVLIGTEHPIIDDLIKSHKWTAPDLQPGDGDIEVVKKAFGEKSALVVTGGDAAGVNRAVQQLAETFPHIWQRGKDRTTLDDVEDDVRKFVAGRSPAGQAAMSLYKLDRLATELKGKDLESAHVKVFVEKAEDGLAAVVKQQASASIKAASVSVDVQNLDVQHGRTLVDEDFVIPSEVDAFWVGLRTRVIPSLKKRPVVSIEARLSEPPEVRKQIEQQARAELVKAGADDNGTSVTVLSAYKQGYSWLYDVVRPALAGKAVEQITIRFAEIGPPAGWTQQGMYAPSRWLLELYPIDEILANELKIDLKKIHFAKAPIGSPAYEVTATSRDGAVLFKRTFDPKFVERPFFDRFPDYEHVRVTTGWIRADVAGRTVVDERIETDPERFWDHFQAKTLPALYDHVMALSNGKPRPEDAPFFGELNVDLSMSEPDYRLPIDQEQISSMEALHEEIYFNTIHFFDVMGRFTRGAGLTYPGRIIPVMHPKADGKPGRARISITGFDAARPSVVVEYTERNGQKGEVRLDIPKIAVDRPQTLGARVRAGQDGVDRLDLRLKVDTEKDEREALVKRSDETRVDRTMISAEQANAVFTNLARLHDARLYRDALAYNDLGNLRITIGWEHESKPATEIVSTLDSHGVPAPFPNIKKYLADDRSDDRRIRRSDRAMGHADSTAGGVRDPREDVGIQAGDGL